MGSYVHMETQNKKRKKTMFVERKKKYNNVLQVYNSMTLSYQFVCSSVSE